MIGKILSGYKLIEIIGTGGMSKVYLARDIKTGKKVAIKILSETLSSDPEYIKRFSREIEISKTLSHSNIVKIISYGKSGDNYYIVYEYIDGLTLDKYIKSRKLKVSEIENIILKILSGLSYAHKKGIIHRDIKPSNIIISSTGKVKLLDFGIAKAATKSTITKTGMFIGSVRYISPEQIDGKKVDSSTDIYSLGIVIYEMVTGKVPFEADTLLGFAKAHSSKPVPKIRKKLPSYLLEIIYKCLAKTPKERYRSADEIIKEIDRHTSKTVVREAAYKPEKVNKPAVAFGILSFVLLIVVIVLSINISSIKGKGEVAKEAVSSEVIENINIEDKISPPQIRKITASKTTAGPLETIEIGIDYQSKDDIKVMWSASYGVIENASSENTKWTAPENTGSYLIEVTITDTEDRIDSLGITVEVAEEFAIEEEVAPLDEIAEEADIVTDIDGNVYHTVTIGTQVWMVENLKVTHYRNGDPIPNVTDGTQWESLKTGAYCSYNNDVNNAITYGSLYNWYAVNDSRNIAPEGWHVPTNAEWETLEMYLGGSVASGKMKETGITHWNSPNTGATNESGFTALPGGYRDYYGPFYLIGYDGFWWSATKSSDPYTWHRLLSYDSSSIGRYGSFSGELGCSIRCLRD